MGSLPGFRNQDLAEVGRSPQALRLTGPLLPLLDEMPEFRRCKPSRIVESPLNSVADF